MTGDRTHIKGVILLEKGRALGVEEGLKGSRGSLILERSGECHAPWQFGGIVRGLACERRSKGKAVCPWLGGRTAGASREAPPLRDEGPGAWRTLQSAPCGLVRSELHRTEV